MFSKNELSVEYEELNVEHRVPSPLGHRRREAKMTYQENEENTEDEAKTPNTRNLLSNSTKQETDDFGALGSMQRISATRMVNEKHEDSNAYDIHELDKVIENIEISPNNEELSRLLELIKIKPNLKQVGYTVFPVLKQILEESEDVETLHTALQVVNSLCEFDSGSQETAACIGLFYVSLRFTGEEYHKELRIEAAYMIGQLLQSGLYTIKLMLASGGLEFIVKLLDPDYEGNKELVLLGVDCLITLVKEYGDSYLTIWVNNGALERLVLTLENLISDQGNASYLTKTADLILVFANGPSCAVSKFCEEDILNVIITALHSLPKVPKLQVLHAIQYLASDRSLQSQLENVGVIVDLVKILKNSTDTGVLEITLSCLNSLCKMSPPRLEQAVLAGAVEPLQRIADSSTKKTGSALFLLCSFISASPACRRILYSSNILEYLLDRVNSDLNVLDSIANWVGLEPVSCQLTLSKEDNIRKLLAVFADSSNTDLTLQCVLKILRSSGELCKRVGFEESFMRILAQRLVEFIKNPGMVKNILELLLNIVSRHPKPKEILDKHSFHSIISKILTDSIHEDLVVIQEIANLLLSKYT